ncbi:MAG: restriction endonuclease [Tissierellia bacterium]|nr:restriction endonuclease [Tissierellia bacterium]
MNAQDLKNSILQLAIRGKLVEQREEEGTAKELLKKIEAEKKQLIKQGKIKKTKMLPEIKEDEIPFDIPESWEWVRLTDMGITQTGNTPSKTKMEFFGDFIPFISPGDILNGVINYKNQGLSEQGKEVGRVSERNSILQVCIGGSIGKCAINSVDVSYNQQINAITPLVCNHLYVYYLMDSKFFLISMIHKATGTATPIINKSSWESIIVPFPPLEEQKRIVAKIAELMPCVEKYDSAYSEVEELNKKFPEDMQKSILQYAIQGKLVEQREEDGTAEELYKQIQEDKKKLIREGKIKKTKELPEITEDEIPFDIPESWKWVRLGDIIDNDLGGGTPSKQKPSYWNGNIPWMSVKDFSNNPPNRVEDTLEKITEEGLYKSSSNFIPASNIIVCTRVGLGKIAVNVVDVAINQDLRALFLSKYIDKKYFLHYYSRKNVVGKGTTVKGIKREELLRYLFPLPPVAEQKRIVAKIEELVPLAKQLVK